MRSMSVAGSNKPSVLIVDDEPLSRLIVSRKLSPLANLIEAGDGEEAIAHLQSTDVHLVIVDLEMPRLNGLELIKFMREHPTLRNIPIIVLTSNELDGLQNSFTAGVTSALMKPLNWHAFGEHVRHVLELAFRASHLALRDQLTGLANRVLFDERLRHALAFASDERTVAIYVLDLDHFKDVNDTLGHGAGDDLLVEVARRLRGVAKDADCVARLGGDEFALVHTFPGADPERAEKLGHNIIEALGKAYALPSGPAQIGVSVGIEVANLPGVSPDQILRNADVALYGAKKAGRSTVRTFCGRDRASLASHETLLTALRAKTELWRQAEIVFQPVCAITGGKILGCEAMFRWRDHSAGSLEGAALASALEGHDAKRDLDIGLLQRALAHAGEWPSGIGLTLNIDPRHFEEGELAETLARLLADARMEPRRLTLEIASRQLTEQVLRRKDWLRIADSGVEIAVDDIGFGALNPEPLEALPITRVKLHESLIDRLPWSAAALRTVRGLVGFATALGYRVGASGVETEEQRAILADKGCVEAQGAYFARWAAPECLMREFERIG